MASDSARNPAICALRLTDLVEHSDPAREPLELARDDLELARDDLELARERDFPDLPDPF